LRVEARVAGLCWRCRMYSWALLGHEDDLHEPANAARSGAVNIPLNSAPRPLHSMALGEKCQTMRDESAPAEVGGRKRLAGVRHRR
jgi:hypothetical protein